MDTDIKTSMITPEAHMSTVQVEKSDLQRAKDELALLTFGTQEYENKSATVNFLVQKELDGLLEEHIPHAVRRNLGNTAIRRT